MRLASVCHFTALLATVSLWLWFVSPLRAEWLERKANMYLNRQFINIDLLLKFIEIYFQAWQGSGQSDIVRVMFDDALATIVTSASPGIILTKCLSHTRFTQSQRVWLPNLSMPWVPLVMSVPSDPFQVVPRWHLSRNRHNFYWQTTVWSADCFGT